MLRPLLFRVDPERMHGWAIRAGELAASSRWLCSTVAARQAPASDRLALTVGGIRFRTPVGLAAGFDKSARAVPFLAALGFGHVEVGSISADPSAGNPRPRLFRLPLDRAIVVNYGLPNDGAVRVAVRLPPSSRLGASLVQLLTALVYEGPAMVSTLNRRLARLLEADGFGHVGEAVGIDALDARRDA